MNAYMDMLFQMDNPDARINYIDGLDADRFSLVTFIDRLTPTLVWESNLRFGSFHMIKMSLFIRNLARRNLFTAETELALAKLILQHVYYLNWLRVSGDTLIHGPEPVDEPVEKMLSEIEKGNAHNAYYYALAALNTDREDLFIALMQNGAVSIQDTIGHSISCFYPVLEEVISVDHQASGTSLLSLILYLCRFRNSCDSFTKKSTISDEDKKHLLAQASSGSSIVDIHQMITFYTMQAWEKASWNKGTNPPWMRLADWIGDKQVDKSRKTQADDVENKGLASIPESYEAWQQIFHTKDIKAITVSAITILDESYAKACDWFFRVYAEQYTPDWNPHYITSLYSALELSRDESIPTQFSRMALIQALEYFLEGIE